jgi:hypothetical protein
MGDELGREVTYFSKIDATDDRSIIKKASRIKIEIFLLSSFARFRANLLWRWTSFANTSINCLRFPRNSDEEETVEVEEMAERDWGFAFETTRDLSISRRKKPLNFTYFSEVASSVSVYFLREESQSFVSSSWRGRWLAWGERREEKKKWKAERLAQKGYLPFSISFLYLFVCFSLFLWVSLPLSLSLSLSLSYHRLRFVHMFGVAERDSGGRGRVCLHRPE